MFKEKIDVLISSLCLRGRLLSKISKQKKFFYRYIVLILLGALISGCNSFLSKVCFSIEGKRLHGKTMILMSEFLPDIWKKMEKWERV